MPRSRSNTARAPAASVPQPAPPIAVGRIARNAPRRRNSSSPRAGNVSSGSEGRPDQGCACAVGSDGKRCCMHPGTPPRAAWLRAIPPEWAQPYSQGASKLISTIGPVWSVDMGQPSLAERLGYGAEDRLLIVNCDDLGSSHAANVATFRSMAYGVATSATLMVPCPWAREAARMFRGYPVGVHLTLTCEYRGYRW